MERLPQTLHTYIQPHCIRRRHKPKQYIAVTLIQQHCQSYWPISQSYWTAVIE